MGTRASNVALNEEEIILVERRREEVYILHLYRQCQREGNKAWMASEGTILRGTNDNFSHVAATLLFDTRRQRRRCNYTNNLLPPRIREAACRSTC